MARKVFISFLGTSNYVTCKYTIGGLVSYPVRFVQEALIAHLCKNWNETDRIYVFCTSKEKTGEAGSKEANWLDDGQEKIVEEIERIGLAHRLNDLKEQTGLKPQIEEVDIEAGFSEEEIWGIFQTVYSKLEPNDEIYFDVTHAFRSIPMFSTVLFNFSKFMLGTRIVSIKYGAFEKLGPAYKVRQIPVEKRVANVIDLTDIARLQEYNQQASNLKEFGKMKQLGITVHEAQEGTPDRAIHSMSRAISQLDEYIATTDLKNIREGKYIAKFRDNYNHKGTMEKFSAPIRNILDGLYQETAEFEEKSSWKNIEAAINWTILHDMQAQTYPLTREYVCTRLAEKYCDLKTENFKKQKDYKEFISAVLGMNETAFLNPEEWEGSVKENEEVIKALSQEEIVLKLRTVYGFIIQLRNDLVHCNGDVTYKRLRNGIPKVLQCVSMLNEEYNRYPSTLRIKEMWGI